MKQLVDYIKECLVKEECSEKKTFNFSFKDLPNAKETIESLTKMAEDKNLEFEASEDSFSLTLSCEDCENKERVAGIQDILQQYSDINRSDSKNASSESYAQLTKSFMLKVDDMVKFIDHVDEEDEEDDKSSDEKKDDEE